MFHIYADGNLIYQPLDETMILYSPKITLEMGKAGSLEFMIPPNHRYYGALHQLKTVITVELDDEEIFRGRVLSIKRNINNIRTIYCEGDLAYLVDSVQKGEKYTGTTHDLFRRIIASHNARVEKEKRFAVGSIGIENREVILTGQSEETENPDTGAFDYKQIAINSVSDDWQTTYDYIQTCLIDYCGGYLRTRRVGDVTYLDILENYGNTALQEIEFGVNLLDLEEEITSEELFTVLIPLGDENLTISSVNNGSDELVDEKGVATYGRILKTHVFSNVNKPETLLENAQRFLVSKTNIPATIVIKAVDLHLINPDVKEIHVGDIVHVASSPHGLIDNLTCTKIEYDFENPSNNTYTFGTPKQTLTERYREDARKASEENKRGRGGSGGGTGKAASEETKKELEDFYNAYIGFEKDQGTATLYAIYEDIENSKKVLSNYIGIDLNAPDGTLNLKNLRTEFDDLGKEVKYQAAKIDLVNDEHGARIKMIASSHQKLEETETAHYATFTLTADELRSAIKMKADQIDVEAMTLNLKTTASLVDQLQGEVTAATTNISTIFEIEKGIDGKIKQNEANITALADATKSEIALVTKTIADKEASIIARANQQESMIMLKADKTFVNSKVTTINGKLNALEADIGKLKAKVAEIDTIKANYITTVNINSYIDRSNVTITDRLSVNGWMYYRGQEVATKSWVRELISELTIPWAKVTGKPTSFLPTKHHHSFSFEKNIANGHTHKVKVGTTTYTSQGVSTNITHKLTISGQTGDYGG